LATNGAIDAEPKVTSTSDDAFKLARVRLRASSPPAANSRASVEYLRGSEAIRGA